MLLMKTKSNLPLIRKIFKKISNYISFKKIVVLCTHQIAAIQIATRGCSSWVCRARLFSVMHWLVDPFNPSLSHLWQKLFAHYFVSPPLTPLWAPTILWEIFVTRGCPSWVSRVRSKRLIPPVSGNYRNHSLLNRAADEVSFILYRT